MPQQQWTDKEERKYRHIRDSAEERGESEDRAEEIAARTVNKQRAREGKTRTASRSSLEDMPSSKRGGQRSHSGPKGRTKEQLYQEARRKNIKGRSKMTKAELLRAVERKRK
jgi:plasmid stabilization system protein ParE